MGLGKDEDCIKTRRQTSETSTIQIEYPSDTEGEKLN